MIDCPTSKDLNTVPLMSTNEQLTQEKVGFSPPADPLSLSCPHSLLHLCPRFYPGCKEAIKLLQVYGTSISGDIDNQRDLQDAFDDLFVQYGVSSFLLLHAW